MPPGLADTGNEGIELTQLAVQTNFWPLYEIEKGQYKINRKPDPVRPITDWLEPQGRFKHLLQPENKQLVAEIQEQVERRWQNLLSMEKKSNA